MTYDLHRPAKDFAQRPGKVAAYLRAEYGRGSRQLFPGTWLLQTVDRPAHLYRDLLQAGAIDTADQVLVLDLLSDDWAPQDAVALPFLPEWLFGTDPASLVAHHGRRAPFFSYMAIREGTARLMPSLWAVTTGEEPDLLFKELAAEAGPDDGLLVTAYPPVAFQGLDLPALSGTLVAYHRYRPQPDLRTYLRTFADWWHNMRATWIVATTMSAAELLHDLQGTVPFYDGLAVVDFRSADYAHHGTDG